MSNDLMEPATCSWCEKQYEEAEGGYVFTDNLCPKCLENEKEIN